MYVQYARLVQWMFIHWGVNVVVYREEECLTALNMFNGRWYAQRQLSCELCHVTKWKSAICGVSICACACVRSCLCVCVCV